MRLALVESHHFRIDSWRVERAEISVLPFNCSSIAVPSLSFHFRAQVCRCVRDASFGHASYPGRRSALLPSSRSASPRALFAPQTVCGLDARDPAAHAPACRAAAWQPLFFRCSGLSRSVRRRPCISGGVRPADRRSSARLLSRFEAARASPAAWRGLGEDERGALGAPDGGDRRGGFA